MKRVKVGGVFESPEYGKYGVIEKLNMGMFRIQFLATGYETVEHCMRIARGQVVDATPVEPVMTSERGEELTVYEIKYRGATTRLTAPNKG